jgi:ankyrin repeat protein
LAGRAEVVKMLLEQKADASTKNKAGKTALDLANEYKHTPVVEILQDSA